MKKLILFLLSLFPLTAYSHSVISDEPVILNKTGSVTTLNVHAKNKGYFSVYLMFYFEHDDRIRESITKLIDPTTPPRYPRLLKMKTTIVDNHTGETQTFVDSDISKESTSFKDAVIYAPIATFKLKKGDYTISVETLSKLSQPIEFTTKVGFDRWWRK